MASGIAVRSSWRPAATTAAALGLWLLLGLANPGTTYHFAPFIVAAAAPVMARLDAEARLSWPRAVRLALGSVAAAGVGMALLWLLGTLDGPALVGGSAPAETALAIAVGGSAGLLVGRFPARTQRRATRPAREWSDADGR